MHANQTSQHAATQLAVLKTWQVFPLNGSYVQTFHLAKHTQDPTELCSQYDEDNVQNSQKEVRVTPLLKSSLEEENLSNATAAAYMNETTKKVRRVLDRNAQSRDLNEEEATAIGEEVAEVPVEEDAKSEAPILVSLPPVFDLDNV